MIAATVVVMGDLKIKISMKVICLGGRIGWRWLANTEKWPKRVVVAEKIYYKNAVTSGDCIGANGNGGYDNWL